MNYYRMVYYTTGDEYETRERLIDSFTYREFRKAIMDGATHLDLREKGMIKTSAIKEFIPANDVVKEYTSSGMTLKELGLPERQLLESGTNEDGFTNLGEEMRKRLNSKN